MRSKPETIANLSVKEYCFAKKQIQGVVEASQFKWTFTYSFNKGQLKVNPVSYTHLTLPTNREV